MGDVKWDILGLGCAAVDDLIYVDGYSNGSLDDRPRHQGAFEVKVIDTTGCGDVFHGAYAAALAENLPLDEREQFAAAAASLKAAHRGGQAGIPIRSAVEVFLKEH